MVTPRWCVACNAKILTIEEMKTGETCFECRERSKKEEKDDGANISA